MDNADYDKVAIGRRLKKNLEKRGITQKQAAIFLNVQTDTIGKVFRGERNITVPNLIKLHNRYNLDIIDILLGEKNTDSIKEPSINYGLSERDILLEILKNVRELNDKIGQ